LIMFVARRGNDPPHLMIMNDEIIDLRTIIELLFN